MFSNKIKVVFRADASPIMGSGHVMRCIALAQEIREQGGDVHFVAYQLANNLISRIRSEGFLHQELSSAPGSNEDAKELLNYSRSNQLNWIVVDGYHFGERYLEKLSKRNEKLLVFDDSCTQRYFDCDILLNHNAYSEDFEYLNLSTSVTLLKGAQFTLLRKEFSQFIGKQKSFRKYPETVILTLGGGETPHLTSILKIMVESLPRSVKIQVITGHNSELMHLCEDGDRIEYLSNIKTMSSLFENSDLAISAAGSTVWELAFMGIPFVLVSIADNQRPACEWLKRKLNVPYFDLNSDSNPSELVKHIIQIFGDSNLRLDLSRKLQKMIDGFGAQRVIEKMKMV